MIRSAGNNGETLSMSAHLNDERELVAAARAGDVRAFETLVRRHYATLYRFALGITHGNEAEASDLLQEALVKAFLAMGCFEGRSSFPSWLWRIIRNEYTDHLRRTHGESTPIDQIEHLPDHSEDPEEAALAEERRQILWRLLAALPEIFADVIILVEIMGLSYEEAAEYLGIPIGSVRSRLSRARERLAKLAAQERELFTRLARLTERGGRV